VLVEQLRFLGFAVHRGVIGVGTIELRINGKVQGIPGLGAPAVAPE
jgi:hypothetical protein